LRIRTVVLEELGYTVKAVCCSVEALELFCSEAFDLVVTDYRMPQLNGMELIARIRETRPLMPIVLISSLVEALGLSPNNTGADIVIQKNAHEVGSLSRAVTRLLARRLPRKPARTDQNFARTRPVPAMR
jgi:two-component system response regulator AtoC